jgi:dipeptidyl aminopeptidase/acylaminoacyl peptidase
MKKWAVFIIGVLFFTVVLFPVLIAQGGLAEQRSLVGVSLATLEYEQVRFQNGEQGIELAGMLFVPEGEGPFPAVIVIHGSGTSRRDNPWYLALTSHLQQQGVVVLLPDKRGSVGSGGNWRTSSLEDLATDTIAALEFLSNQERIEISKLGIIGMSQGGQIAPVVAAEADDLDFIVNVVGSSLPIYDVLHYEETNNLRELGLLPGVSDLIAYPSTFILREFSQREFWDAVGNFDPLAYWREVEVPAMVLYGSEDTNVPSEESKARLESLKKDNIVVFIFDGSGHALEDPPATGNKIFRQDALEEIGNFISGQNSSGS